LQKECIMHFHKEKFKSTYSVHKPMAAYIYEDEIMYNNEKGKFEFRGNIINSDVWKWKAVETIGVVILINGIIHQIPFVPKVGHIIQFTSSVTAAFFTIKGVGEDSLMQRLLAEIKFKKNRKVMHLRSAEYVRKQRNANGMEREDQSIAEYYIGKSQKFISDFIEKNSEE